MAASLGVVESVMTDGRYGVVFEHQWRTHNYALSAHVMDALNSITGNRKWGWHFSPHQPIPDYTKYWYKDQVLIITFEDRADLIQAKLEVAHLL